METWTPERWNALTAEDVRRVLAPYAFVDAQPRAHACREAAVLAPLLRVEGEWHLLFTRRTDTVHDHKGQVSFPGGAAEPCDGSPETTALREAFEEIGLDPSLVRVLGKMPLYDTVSRFCITPVVGWMDWPVHLECSPTEVSRVFTAPLSWLADPAHFEERPYRRPTGVTEPVVFYEEYDGELIWGITGRMTLNFIQLLQQSLR